MKLYLFTLSVLVLLSTSAIANDCKSLAYSSNDFAYLVDFDGSMDNACKSAEKNAIWKACVKCAGDDQRNQQCHFKQVENKPNNEKNLCLAHAEVTSENCVGGPAGERPLVHCGKITE